MHKTSDWAYVFALDGKGGGFPLSPCTSQSWRIDKELLWVQMDYTVPDARQWLLEQSGIDPIIAESMMAEETRPRYLIHNSGMLVVLRGVNLNPGADPEDMVSLRVWIDKHLIVTLRHRQVMAVKDLETSLQDGKGPTSPGTFLENLTERLVSRMASVIADVDDTVDTFEDEILAAQDPKIRARLAEVRRTVIAMRRHLAPQRDVMARLYMEKVDWLGDQERMSLRELSDRTTRFVEDLDAIRDRATLLQEELNSRLAEQMNQTMYVLSIVASLFLPLGFLTGLLGINLSGIPGAASKWGFGVFCLILTSVASFQIWYFKKKKWM